MTSNRYCIRGSALAAALLLVATAAHAQVSDARLKELIRQAGEIANAQTTLTTAQVPAENGPVVPITLDEAVKFALERNLDIAVQRQNPELQDIAIASAYAAFSPTVTSQVSRAAQTSAPTNQLQ